MNDTKTVTGAIVHVTDADEAPLVRCLVDITPKQSGTGTPSPENVRQISGWTEVKVIVSPTQEATDGTTTTTSLGRTVYGGTLDVVSGVLSVDRAMVDLGTLTWAKSATSAGSYRFYSTDIAGALSPIGSISDTANLVCSQYVAYSFNQVNANTQGIYEHTNKSIGVFDLTKAEMSVDDFKTAMDGVQLIYELATPQTYTLTGQEISALYGENYIWANSGDTTIEYTYLPHGLYGEIRLDGEFLPKPRDFKPGREDVYAGEYTTCTGKTIADKIGWKFSDLDLQWDALKQSDIDKLINLTNACSLRFDDADGLHTEDVIRTSAVSLRNRNTINGVTWWRDVSAQFKFINTHNE